MSLSVEKLARDKKGRVLITSVEGNWYIQGWLSQDWSTTLASSYQSAADFEKFSIANKFIAAASSISQRFGGPDWLNGKITSIASTMLSWQGADNFTFPLRIDVLATSQRVDPRDIIKKLIDATLPTKAFGADNFVTFLRPPLGYAAGRVGDPKGCVAVEIGQWLKIPPIMVIESANFSVSKETTTKGVPLLVSVQISLKACKLVDAALMKTFLPGIPG